MSRLDVITRLNYLIPTEEKPIYYASQGGAEAQLRISARFEEREVEVHNARELDAPPDLDRQGFALARAPTAVADFYATGEHWRDCYESELGELILGLTGGAEIFIFDHTLRSDSSAVRGERSIREPATVIHNDYTDASAERRLRDLIPGAEVERWLDGRYAIINAWRSVRGTVVTTPLACCDATTLAPGDLVASERRAEERIGELELVRWNPAHRWFYFPAMDEPEVLLIKTYDSARDGRARRSIHSAFANPLAPADAPPRESIESRTIVRFDP